MLQLDPDSGELTGPHGRIAVRPDDEITRKLLMLAEGQCNGLGAQAAAAKYGYSRQRYYQLLHRFERGGAIALASEKRGPKTNYRRTPELEAEVVRLMFLDRDASASVVAQKLQQRGFKISARSVHRVINKFGLKKNSV